MKILDIIKELQKNLPYHTDLFSEKIIVKDASITGKTLTLALDPSQTISLAIQPKNKIFVSGIRLKNPITNVETNFYQDGTIEVTITTAEDHDVVRSNEIQFGEELYNIEVRGLTPAEYNGVFPLVYSPSSVPNRYQFKYKITSINDIQTINGFVIEPAMTANFFTGYHAVKTNNGLTLTYDLLDAVEQAPQYIPFVDPSSYILFDIRISGSIHYDVFSAFYSKQKKNNFWLCVVGNDMNVSKSYRNDSDVTQAVSAGSDPRQRHIQTFTLFVFAPLPQNTEDDSVSGRILYDKMQDLYPAIMKSIANSTLPTDYYEIPWSRVCAVNHGFVSYNNAVYVYQYTFEVSVDATYKDMKDRTYPSRAFRDLYARYLSQLPNNNDILAEFHLDLDES